MKRLGWLVVGMLMMVGCVSRKEYVRKVEALSKSLELNKRCIETVGELEGKNKSLNKVFKNSMMRQEEEGEKLLLK